MNEVPNDSLAMADLPAATAMSQPSSTSAPQPQGLPSAPIRLKRILTPIDFSDAANKALKYASALAAQFQSQLVLLHVVEFNYVGSEFGAIELSQMTAEMQENAAKHLEEWRAREVGDRVTAECLVRTGRPYHEIIEVAAQSNIDLVIIASHGHTSLAHIVLGSTVERVVRYAPCPVLVVRRQEREFV